MRLGSNGVKAAFLGLMLSANPGWSNDYLYQEKVKGARRARFEQEARRREEVIARRKAESGAGPTATKPKP